MTNGFRSCSHVMCWFRWWRRAPRSFAGWRSVLQKQRRGAAKMQWACKRHSPLISLRLGEYSRPHWKSFEWNYLCFFTQKQLDCVWFLIYLSRPMDAVAEGRNPAPDSLWRRYSEFELLRNYLIVTYPYIVVPPLPEKRVSFCSQNPVRRLLYQFIPG